MESLLKHFFPEESLTKPYQNYLEYLMDLSKQIEMVIMYYLRCMPKNTFQTYDFDVDINKNDAFIKDSLLFKINDHTTKFDYFQAEFHMSVRLNKSDDNLVTVFDYLKDLFNLSNIEQFCLIAAMMPDLDEKYKRLFASINRNNLFRPTYDSILRLFYFTNSVSDIDDFYSKKQALQEKMSFCFFEPGKELKVDPSICSFILSNGSSVGKHIGIDLYEPNESKPLPALDDIAQNLFYATKKTNAQRTIFFYIHGQDTIGKRTQVKRFAELMDTSVVFVDLKKVEKSSEETLQKSIDTALRISLLYDSAICIFNLDLLQNENDSNKKILSDIIQKIATYGSVVFLLSNSELKDKSIAEDKLWIDVPMRYPNKEESIVLWAEALQWIHLEETVEPYELANKFTFTPGQINGTLQDAYKVGLWNKKNSLNKKELYRCAYAQITHNLSNQADLIYARYNWDQLILPADQKEMLMNACNQIKYKHIVYNKWGMEKRLSYGKGVSMLFAGPPGTGKTMGAQVVANELDIEIYKVDLSQIVSKYIGETEKNLNQLFQEAKKSNVILFFDETDAILGKRTEVKDSHDKNANLETSYLLQKMEEYDGITVMTTNYLENIDSAFFRRISYVIHFPFPDPVSRKQIWINMFPQEMPLDEDIDFDYLAKQFEISGGSIKNIAVSAAFLAAKNQEPVDMTHILKALKYELTKQGKTMLREDFGEHYYLM